MASTSSRSVWDESPSSRISDRLSASGRAPDTARSFTVPFTASSPIEPPGNRIGLTTNESVVMTRPSSTAPASASASDPNAGANRPSIIDCVALPPAPCDIVTCSSRNLPCFARAVSMIPRIFVSRSETASRHTTSRSRAKRPKL